jgi:hypothetical protein
MPCVEMFASKGKQKSGIPVDFGSDFDSDRTDSMQTHEVSSRRASFFMGQNGIECNIVNDDQQA